jgi:GNAT superfamily N-acetyltransferase
MTFAIRRARLANLDTVTGLLRKLYAGHHTTGELLAENEILLTNPTQVMFLACDGARAVGVAHAAKRLEYVEGSHGDVCGYLEAIYVEPAYHRRGVAKALLDQCEKWALEQGCTMFASDCEVDNADSLTFHLAVGFSEVSRNIHFAKPLRRERPLYRILPLTEEFRAVVDGIASATWGGGKIAVHGELYDLSRLLCYTALSDSDEPLGYCYYRIADNECEIMALESLRPRIGIATALLEAVRGVAAAKHCGRLYLQTSNDNTHALRFYQRRGFVISEVRVNGMDLARRLKPSIPLVGEDGIPLRDEIELAMALPPAL